jgi:hypothetical protein
LGSVILARKQGSVKVGCLPLHKMGDPLKRAGGRGWGIWLTFDDGWGIFAARWVSIPSAPHRPKRIHMLYSAVKKTLTPAPMSHGRSAASTMLETVIGPNANFKATSGAMANED